MSQNLHIIFTWWHLSLYFILGGMQFRCSVQSIIHIIYTIYSALRLSFSIMLILFGTCYFVYHSFLRHDGNTPGTHFNFYFYFSLFVV